MLEEPPRTSTPPSHLTRAQRDALRAPRTSTTSYLNPVRWDARRAEIRNGWGVAQDRAEKEARARLAEAAPGLERVPSSSSESSYKCATSAGPPLPRAAAAATDDAATATAAAAAATTTSGARVLTIDLLESSLLDILVAFATKWDGGMKKRWILYNIHAVTAEDLELLAQELAAKLNVDRVVVLRAVVVQRCGAPKWMMPPRRWQRLCARPGSPSSKRANDVNVLQKVLRTRAGKGTGGRCRQVAAAGPAAALRRGRSRPGRRRSAGI